MTSIYDSLGGSAAMDAAVDLFYQKVLADDRINYFFDGIDMDRQRKMQKAFLTFALGGPNNYSGRGMRAAHKRLVEEKGLAEPHFDAVMENLGATLKELNVPDELIAQAAETAMALKPDVLNQ